MAKDSSKEKTPRYLFSIVMAIYNVEDFLEDAIESVVNQTLDFEKHVQLVLVNDGSPDNSEEICLKYKKLYPNNIVYLKKPNGGVSSARNLGIEHAEGMYVNFLDSDDKLSENALIEVYEFFNKNHDLIDVVSLPLFFFDGRKGQHLLNYKFKQSRVIDILKEYTMIQMHISSSFIKLSTLKRFRFNENMRYAEDAELLNKIILEKCKYGVISNAKYYYRRRIDNSSSTQQGNTSKDWYNDNLTNFCLSTLKYSIDKMGYAPEYIQYMVMYDIQWRLRLERFDDSVLSLDEQNIFFDLVKEILSYIDNKIIFEQKSIDLHRKLYLFKLKHENLKDDWYEFLFLKNNVLLKFKGIDLSNSLIHQTAFIDILEIKNKELHIHGFFGSLFNKNDILITAQLNGEECKVQKVDRANNSIFMLGKIVKEYYGFKLTLPINSLGNDNELIFYAQVQDNKVPIKLQFGKFSRVNPGILKGSYYEAGGMLVYTDHKTIFIQKSSFSKKIRKEKKLLMNLYKNKTLGSRKAMLVRLIYHFIKFFQKKKVWLFLDRQNMADDNAEHLFRYALEQDDNIKKVFVVTKESKDYQRLRKLGKVVPFRSHKHKLYHLLADKIISSHADEGIINPFLQMEKYYRDLVKADFVFLQHGIIQNELTKLLNKYNKNIKLFITSASKERDYILTGNYNYDNSIVKLTGLPRYDNLESESNPKKILIAPTWRKGIVNELNPSTGLRAYNKRFKSTDYFKIYNSILNNEKLLSFLEETGYKLVFLPHPNIVQQIKDFNKNKFVEIPDENVRYQTLFKEACMLVTDYSSVAFDVAYLKKPIIYYHGIENHLESGYFDYESMGFGEICNNVDELIEKIIEYAKNEFKMKDEYVKRVENFYAYTDKNNCKRVYEEIRNME